MNTSVCFVYPWATFGGCERILLNRVMAFKEHLPDLRVDFLFLSDGGGLKDFQAALKAYQLTEVARTVTALDGSYDLVSLIDCPQFLDEIAGRQQKYIVECHTAYTNNRKYLAQLRTSETIIVTPSQHFSAQIRREFSLSGERVRELRNFVPWDLPSATQFQRIQLPEWGARPILFFGRMDHLKDPIALLDAFCLLNKQHRDEYLLLLCGPQTTEIDISQALSARKLLDSTVVLPPIPFPSAQALLQAVANRGGLFVSPSQGESFGLSAAEAICTPLPVVLSDIEAHQALVAPYQAQFTYPQGNPKALAERIHHLARHQEASHAALLTLRQQFSAESFMYDWQSLLKHLET
ncbi:Glycosyl transferase, group 1 [gamma proteobacterium HdN1]|nr:Glycosyl transferase, group 1 [gamma proteobacterium HdN1]